jgi:hypothetical protein
MICLFSFGMLVGISAVLVAVALVQPQSINDSLASINAELRKAPAETAVTCNKNLENSNQSYFGIANPLAPGSDCLACG